MRRRELLTSAVVGTAWAVLPPSLRRALAFPSDGCREDDARLVRQALDRGGRTGKPVVVLVVPANEGRRDEHSTLFGTLLDLGPDRALAVLALAEVVCARLDAVRCVIPSTPAGKDGPPLMVLIDAGSNAPTLVAPALPRAPYEICPSTRDPAVEAACLRRATRALCDAMIAPLRHALLGDGFGRRVRRNVQSLGPETEARVRAAATDGAASLPLALVDAAAPLLLASVRATRSNDARRRTIARLAAAGRLRLQEKAPLGARWARLDGCGQYAHRGTDDIVDAIGCGLGGVPFLAARFLRFYTASDRG